MSLVPRRRLGPRLAVLAALILFILLGSPSALNLLGFALAAALVLGTFPRAYVSQAEFETELLVMFIPVRATRHCLKDFEAIETDVRTTGVGLGGLPVRLRQSPLGLGSRSRFPLGRRRFQDLAANPLRQPNPRLAGRR